MPELPEVETIRLQLVQFLPGQTIQNIHITKQKSFVGDHSLLIGATIGDIQRYGKMLCIELSGGFFLVVHLKMTGQLLYRPPEDMSHNMRGDRPLLRSLPNRYTRVIITFTNNHQLFFNDMRVFGWLKIVEIKDLEKIRNSLGPDPLSELDEKTFFHILQSSKRPVKLVPMDQEKIAGIGNIYANDALFLSGIHPKTAANKLSKNKTIKLRENIRKVLARGIRYKGASRTNFRDVFGEKGSVQEHFHVYDQAGKPCPNGCGETIRRIKLGGRGTFFCPKCQIIV